MNKPTKKPFRQVLMVTALSIMMVILPLNSMRVKASEASFLAKVGPAAIQMGRETGRFPSVAIAQAILESGWGESELARSNHNILGIKGNNGYRYFESIEESMRYYGTLFTKTYALAKHYEKFLNANSVEEAAFALSGTYAESADYGNHILDVIDRYDLRYYDYLAFDPEILRQEEEEKARIEAERIEAERIEAERIAKEQEMERVRLEAIRLESLKTRSQKYEEAYIRLMKDYAEKYNLDVKIDIGNLKFNGMYYELKPLEESVLEKGV